MKKNNLQAWRLGKLVAMFTITAVMFNFIGVNVFVGHLGLGTLFRLDFGNQEANALIATSSVTVPNAVPNTPTNARELPISSSASPTNAGGTITFYATTTDPNSDDWNLKLCSTNSTTGLNCTATTYCTGNVASSSKASNCTYTTAGGDSETNAWYAFACDATGCSTNGSQGDLVDGSESPFIVNHAPTFTTLNTPAVNPGATATFIATTTDTDVSGSQDNISLYVCSTNSFSTSTGCAGVQLCTATAAGNLGSVSCTYNFGGRTVTPDGGYAAWGFIKDTHNMPAAANGQGGATNLTVNNVTPVVSNFTMGAAVTLSPNSTTSKTFTFDATDNNSCVNLASTSAEMTYTVADFYRSGVVSGPACTNDSISCYRNVLTCQQSGCAGSTTATVTFTCTTTLWFNAEPTDAGSRYPAEFWLAAAVVSDNNSATSTQGISSGNVEINQTMAYDVVELTIPYYSVGAGATSTNDATTTLRSIGNTGVVKKVDGNDMVSGGNTIPVAKQRWGTAAGFSYNAGTPLTIGAPVSIATSTKSVSTSTPASVKNYWKIAIPGTQQSGIYESVTNITGAVSASGSW